MDIMAIYGYINNALVYLEQLNLLSILLRMLLAIFCGGLLGLERGRAHQAAGMRTYMLVCMGAAIVMITGQYSYEYFGTGDPVRLGAQVVSGIGFLGAGSIIISGKTRIRGLTTAAGLWTAACIGLCIGIGFFEGGIIATILVNLIMTHFKRLEYRLMLNEVWFTVYMEIDKDITVAELSKKLIHYGLEIGEMHVDKRKKGFQKLIIDLKNTHHIGREEIIENIQNLPGVHFAKFTS